MAYDAGLAKATVKTALTDIITGNTFKVALFSVGVTRDPLTAIEYDVTGEITATGYTAGGLPVSITIHETIDSGVPVVTFSVAEVTITATTFSSDAWCIYDTITNKVFACGKYKEGTVSVTNGTFRFSVASGEIGVSFNG